MSDLNQLIRDVAESLPDDATPRDIAEAVIEKVGVEALTVHVADLLTVHVADVLRSERNSSVGQTKNPKSSKLDRRRDWWTKMLGSRVAVGNGQWKPLGECTVDDLRFLVADRKDHIKNVQMQINSYQHLIERMEKNKALKVSDLKVEQVDL